MHRHFRKSSISRDERYKGQHRFEHWYLDNCVYFITARCRDRFPAFASEAANNHYHTIGYLKIGENLGPMMQRIHGSVAKLVNDLPPRKLKPFWYDSGKQGYFDGCIRDELQARRGYRYILRQSERHGIVRDWRKYPHTRVNVELERAIERALELKGVPEGCSVSAICEGE